MWPNSSGEHVCWSSCKTWRANGNVVHFLRITPGFPHRRIRVHVVGVVDHVSRDRFVCVGRSSLWYCVEANPFAER